MAQRLPARTVHFVDEEMDSGPIILQKAVQVKEEDDEESLSARILEQEHELYPESCKDVLRRKNKDRGPQGFNSLGRMSV